MNSLIDTNLCTVRDKTSVLVFNLYIEAIELYNIHDSMNLILLFTIISFCKPTDPRSPGMLLDSATLS